jgi:predicted DNA-binding transcriptional regulator AlpA
MARTSMDNSYIPKYRLETHAEVVVRISRSRSTLSAMRDPDDARFDPTFPEPVPVGPPSNPFASIRFEASEVDAWIESRMDMRPRKRGGGSH